MIKSNRLQLQGIKNLNKSLDKKNKLSLKDNLNLIKEM